MASGGVWPIQALFATMLNINLFQYLAAFITIVLAIALTDLLGSLHRLIVARERVHWSVLPLLAAGFVFVSVVSEFFSIWVVADVARISFAYLLLLVVVPSLLALAAFAVLPDDVPAEGLDLEKFYMSNRVYLYTTLAMDWAGDYIRTPIHAYLVNGANLWTDPKHFAHTAPSLVLIAVFVLLAWSKDRRVHMVCLLGFYLYSCAEYFIWTVG